MRVLHTAHQMYAHITWNTVARSELIDADIKKTLGSIIDEVAEEGGYDILVYEAVSEHVHLAIRFKPIHRISDFVKAIKGKSSRVIPYLLNKPIQWQKGYSVTTAGPKLLKATIKYVHDQKEHHPERNI